MADVCRLTQRKSGGEGIKVMIKITILKADYGVWGGKKVVGKSEWMAWVWRENVNPAFLGRSKRMFSGWRRLKEKKIGKNVGH